MTEAESVENRQVLPQARGEYSQKGAKIAKTLTLNDSGFVDRNLLAILRPSVSLRLLSRAVLGSSSAGVKPIVEIEETQERIQLIKETPSSNPARISHGRVFF